MIAPAVIYIALVPPGPWSYGWGVPMATDTAFAIALIAVMGSRVPIELRIFLTAAAIVDDIGAIIVVALFYSDALHLGALGAAGVVTIGLALLNRSRVYALGPYLLLGCALWFFVHESGLHATLAGVVLAVFIPTRQPPDFSALVAQATAILSTEARRSAEALHAGPSLTSLRVLDSIHDRLQSPADRLLQRAGARSSFFVLPVFALANAGVVITPAVLDGHLGLMLPIIAGLTVGKPLGIVAASVLAVRAGFATKPDAYSWRQLAGAGALAGIGFTMSLFIAGQAFPDPGDFAAAKIAVFVASIIAALAGAALLWNAKEAPGPAVSPLAAGSP